MDIPLYFPKQSKVGYCRKLTHDPIAEAQAKGKTENLPKFRAEYIFRGGNWHRQQKRILGFAVFFTLRKNRETQTRAKEGRKQFVPELNPKIFSLRAHVRTQFFFFFFRCLDLHFSVFSFIPARELLHGSIPILLCALFFSRTTKGSSFLRNLEYPFEKNEFLFALTIPILRSFREVFVGWSKVEKGSRLTWLWFV